MADIISLDNKRYRAEEKKDADLTERKVRAVRSVLQHTGQAPRCEKCGEAFEGFTPPVPESLSLRVPYRFCEACAEEYVDYIERLKGHGVDAHYWQNDAWLQSWTRWIEYQGTVDGYLKSPGFRALLDELKSRGPDE